MEADNGKRASSAHRTHRVRHANERRRDLPSKWHPMFHIGDVQHPLCHAYERLKRKLSNNPVRHYGLLKFLRRATLTSTGGSSSSIYNHAHYAPALRTPGIPHPYLRSGHGHGRGRRAADFMRGVPRADLHTPRGVRRSALGARGLLGGVQCARARAGTEGLARR